MSRPLVAEVNLTALRHNYQLAQQQSASAQAIAVIKADAYGHGAVAVAQALADLAPRFAVACIEEANALRAAGIKQPILLLEGFFSAEELPFINQQGYEIVLHADWQLQQLKKALQKTDAPKTPWLTIWLKVDSGMHRLGFAPEQVPAVCAWLKAQKAVNQLILTSHFACADTPAHPLNARQLTVMQRLQQQLGGPVSLANSPAILAHPAACQGWVRPGILLYGASPLPAGHPLGDQLQTVMTLKSRLISVRDLPAGEAVGYGGRFVTPQPTRLGIVACGYGDGYPRQAIEGTPVAVKGVSCALAGRVSMDLLSVDLRGVPDPQPGDPVELWGPTIDINRVAHHCDTISYTLLTGLLPRVPRIYC